MISDTRVASERTLFERSNRIQYGNLLTLPIADGDVLADATAAAVELKAALEQPATPSGGATSVRSVPPSTASSKRSMPTSPPGDDRHRPGSREAVQAFTSRDSVVGP